jgi:ArsR family transcriptional regulator, arsenate/arsenite/antimonite-responsive transcriptional repressor / arsenate reductase (thioredoxin)
METSDTLAALSALAQEHRLSAFRLLVQAGPAGLSAGEIATELVIAPNSLSFHLDRLRQAKLVDVNRHGRSLIYSARFDTMQALLTYLTENCCGGRPELCGPSFASRINKPNKDMSVTTPLNVLFLCTGNSARSIIAEAILNQDGGGRFRAYSAGSNPRRTVNPFALRVLESYGYSTDGLSSKNWSVYATADASRMDFVFTVCDAAAGEACPLWPGQPVTAHWGIEDPAAAEGSNLDKERAFVTAFKYLQNRITVFLALPFENLSAMALTRELHEIGRLDGATASHAKVF